MQCVADVLGHALVQRDAPEASALGAAYLAGLSLGLWPALDDIAALPRAGRTILPQEVDMSRAIAVWHDAIARSTLPGAVYNGE
jgi:glycerol kinase